MSAPLLHQAELLMAQSKLTVEPFPDAVRKKLISIQANKDPVGACFITDGKTGTIYLDYNNPLGLLLPMFVHELVHAMDRNLWDLANAKTTLETRNQFLIESEILAYQTQHQFLLEIYQVMPELKKYLMDAHPDLKMIHKKYGRDELTQLYRRKVA